MIVRGLQAKKYLFRVVNDAKLGNSGGCHWSLLVVDIEASLACHYPSLSSFISQKKAVRYAVVGVRYVLERNFAFHEESQTPHQIIETLPKLTRGHVGLSLSS